MPAATLNHACSNPKHVAECPKGRYADFIGGESLETSCKGPLPEIEHLPGTHSSFVKCGSDMQSVGATLHAHGSTEAVAGPTSTW